MITEQQFQDCLHTLLETTDFDHQDHWDCSPVNTVQTYKDRDVLTNNKGLIVVLGDGSEFQVTIIKRK